MLTRLIFLDFGVLLLVKREIVLANRHIVISEVHTVDTYISWSHYYEKDDLMEILESKNFKDIKDYEIFLLERDNCLERS